MVKGNTRDKYLIFFYSILRKMNSRKKRYSFGFFEWYFLSFFEWYQLLLFFTSIDRSYFSQKFFWHLFEFLLKDHHSKDVNAEIFVLSFPILFFNKISSIFSNRFSIELTKISISDLKRWRSFFPLTDYFRKIHPKLSRKVIPINTPKCTFPKKCLILKDLQFTFHNRKFCSHFLWERFNEIFLTFWLFLILRSFI